MPPGALRPPRILCGRGRRGAPGGSLALAHMILDRLQIPDVFISADPVVNRLLERPGPGPSAPWFLTLARTEMVIAYGPGSRFAPAFREAAAGRRAWYEVLASPGLRLGRTDPQLDPKGYRTILVLRLAERHYRLPGLEVRLLGATENLTQIFPEARRPAGVRPAGRGILLPDRGPGAAAAVPRPARPGQPRRPRLERAYAQAAYRDPAGQVHRGAPILYTITIPSTVRNPAGAIRFLEFLYGPQGRRILSARGLLRVRVLAGGDQRAVPPPLRPLVQGTYEE